MATPKTILLKSRGNDLVKEAIASEAITPGMLVERNTATGVRKHATAAANARKHFAIEMATVDNTTGPDIDNACASGDQIEYVCALPGDEVYALLAAAATAVTVGAAIESAGDGTVRIASADAATDTTQRDAVIGYALEAVDNSGGGSTARIRIEVA